MLLEKTKKWKCKPKKKTFNGSKWYLKVSQSFFSKISVEEEEKEAKV